ncbi:MAG: hypothetical protein QN122_12440 [Armatimonadota bacterium]|nr:hypothetical protein [Armatimonadota bacterium]
MALDTWSGLTALVIAVVLTLALALPPATAGSTELRRHVAWHRQETWRWQDLMGQPRHPTAYHERWARGAYLRWLADLWRQRRLAARRQASRPPHLAAWLCIHRYEGAWNDPRPPYYGGLQMDLAFQQAYGAELLRRKGTADRWTPLEQMWVAERAWRKRGFTPWPRTARRCGLL